MFVKRQTGNSSDECISLKITFQHLCSSDESLMMDNFNTFIQQTFIP